MPEGVPRGYTGRPKAARVSPSTTSASKRPFQKFREIKKGARMNLTLSDEQQRHIEHMSGGTIYMQGYIRRLIDDDIRRKNLKVVNGHGKREADLSGDQAKEQ